ncbi:hypothetical protein J32TS2_04910 [Shouchella clausii]|uniref:M20/M25/M40 family metallo-hydrolase n=2 Tax=Shouchella clausii TaxID=79880 RepID=UPI001B1C8C98|nr:M20/M25/M40 family metallo-hydrolase [Shouchella clausii]GIN15135.1 hypothetical protein J32TS2_04910 [Shouchella clausii]
MLSKHWYKRGLSRQTYSQARQIDREKRLAEDRFAFFLQTKIEEAGMAMSERYPHAKRVYQLTLELMKQPSISGTTQEREMADRIVAVLERIPYFQAYPQHIKRVPLRGDSLGREAVVALLAKAPTTKKATMLLSHFDVVGVDDFGMYKEDAFTPDLLREKLLAEQEGYLDKDARHDLESGHYLFGRGSMDMKAGLAMQLSVLQDIADDKDAKANVCLVAVPDEEKLSMGMFAAIHELRAMQEDGWNFHACICSEPNFSAYPNDWNKYIYTGSTGKLLPFIYCIGKETHVGQPLEGINAAVMAAQLAVEMEWSERFSNQVDGEVSPSPTCLRIRDLKETYDVQTPNESYLFYNVLTLDSGPQEVMERVKEACNLASTLIYERLLRHRQAFGDESLTALVKQPQVYTLTDLYQLGVQKYGKDAFKDVYEEALSESVAETADYTTQTLAFARRMSAHFLDRAPFYLLLLAPPYYPHVRLDQKQDQRLLALVGELKQICADQFGERLVQKTFFPGLSDVSYCRVTKEAAAPDTGLKEHMPLYERSYHIPLREIAGLDIPTINLGPFGKDAHKRTERLELTYSTEVAPALLLHAVKRLAEQTE